MVDLSRDVGLARGRSLLSKFKKIEGPGPLDGCGFGGIETEAQEFSNIGKERKNITSVEVLARGYSCWLQKKAKSNEESTYGAMMLYGESGGHVLMVNTTGVHTVPIMLNVRANALLQKLDPKAAIKVTFSEFARTPMEMGDFLTRVFTFIVIILLAVAFAFPPPFFVAFIVEEKQCGTKGQLLV
jgi:hypothetical protein